MPVANGDVSTVVSVDGDELRERCDGFGSVLPNPYEDADSAQIFVRESDDRDVIVDT